MPNHENACNDLYIGDTLAGCPTEPFIQKNWRIDLEIPAGTPAIPNARVRCKHSLIKCMKYKFNYKN